MLKRLFVYTNSWWE